MSESVALEANRLVHGDRRGSYGPVEESFQRIASFASLMLRRELSAKDVAVIMLCVKMVRESAKHQRDNLVDICGYADLLQQLYDVDESRPAQAT